jgi:hypothetical protein
MKTLRSRLMASGFAAVAALMLCACAVTGVGVEGSVGYDGGYYAPYGYDYGGWGVGYRAGPPRCCDHRDDHHDEHHDEHHDRPVGRAGGGRAPAYRPAPAGRSAPSIPGRSRGH